MYKRFDTFTRAGQGERPEEITALLLARNEPEKRSGFRREREQELILTEHAETE